MPFRDLITGDEIWVSFDMKSGAIWLPANAELPVLSKGQLQAKVHSDRFLGNSRDHPLLLISKRSHIRFTILL
jgi:hypothetical protein